MISTHSEPTGPSTESLNTATPLIPKLSLLFFLALDGSVDHEVGEVDVALGFLRLWQSAASVTGACKKREKKKNKTNRHFLAVTPGALHTAVTSSASPLLSPSPFW